jgi:hypothetical protein
MDDFQAVSARIIEEHGVIGLIVFGVKKWAFDVFASDPPNNLGHTIDFGGRVHPESDPGTVWLVIRIFGKSEKWF